LACPVPTKPSAYLPVGLSNGRPPSDHWHRDETDEGRVYRFETAEKLIAGFFDEIERILKDQNHG
jgi:hypothetical protein